MQVSIDQTFGQIGIRQKKASFKIYIRPPDVKVSQKPAEIKIIRDRPAVHINQTETLASMGYRNITAFQKHFAQKGRSAVLSGIRKTVTEGDRMGRIVSGEDPIPAMAAESFRDKREFNLALMPKVAPDISFTGKTDIKATWGEVTVRSRINFPEILATRANLKVYLKFRPELNVKVTGNWINVSG